MKKSEMVIIRSTAYPAELSMRGRGRTDVRLAIKAGGFEADDEVVIITQEYFDALERIKNNIQSS